MFDFGISTYIKLGAAIAVLAVIGLGYWHYTSLVDKVSSLQVELATKDKELRSAKAAVEAMNDVVRDAEAQQSKSSTLQTAVAKARVADDVELPKPLADAFLQRFGDGQ
jgi:preprotein translocase subunit SecF